MLSKNNYKERLRKMEPRRERFSIRKFTVGAASVLIGFTIFGLNNTQTVKADTTDNTNTSTEKDENATTSDNVASDIQVNDLKDKTSEVKANKAAKQSETVADQSQTTTDVAKSDKDTQNANDLEISKPVQQENAAVKVANETTVDQAKSKSGNVLNVQKAQTKASEDVAKTLAESKVTQEGASALRSAFIEAPQNTQSQDANDFQSLINAMNNGNVGTINVTSDITITDKVNGTTIYGLSDYYLRLDSKGSARDLVINGNGHTINFAGFSLAFQDRNYTNAVGPWNITLKDVTIEGSKYDYAPLSFYGSEANTEKSKLTFDGVTANLNDRPLVDKYGENLPVHFAGKNNITLNYMSSGYNLVTGKTVRFDSGDTIFNVDSKVTGKAINSNNWVIRSTENASDSENPSTLINEGARVTINAKSDDLRGIYAGRQTLAGQPIYGVTVINGTLNANMAAGHSTAIWSHDLEIGKKGNVTIHTKQTNQADGVENNTSNSVSNYNGTHYAPISLDAGPMTSVASPLSKQTASLINNGSLTIIRDTTEKTLVPLISMGDGGLSTNTTLKFVVGDGATLDLQDNAGTFKAGTEPASPFTGLINLWGTSGTDVLEINNPAYVNLQRTGSIRGTLIRMEGVYNNSTISGPTPIAQWDQGNKTTTPNDVWYVRYLNTKNQWGNNSGQFMGKGQQPNTSIAHKGVDTLYNSNATVLMSKNQGADKYENGAIPTKVEEALHLNSFLNNFNWWRPQRIAMGSKLNNTPNVKINDFDKYQPEVQTINGKTNQTLDDLDAKKGIKDLIGPDEKAITDFDNLVNKVTWYNSGTDKIEWNKIMIQPTDSKDPSAKVPYSEPQNPTGNLKTTNDSAWAKVTYADGSVDFVKIPLHIIGPTDAEKYIPKGQDVKANKGEDLTNKADEAISNKETLPSRTTYTWQTTPKTTTPGKKSAVIVVTYPDGSKDKVPTNVVVNAKPEIKSITTTVGGNPAATEGIANLNDGGTTPVDGYPTSATWTTKPNTSKPGATTGTATVTYPDGTTETVTIPVAVNGQGDVTVIDNGHVFSLHANNVVTHKTSDKNIIGGPVIENFKLSYYQGGQNYSKPYIYTLNADKTAYVLTQTGDNPAGVTVNAPQSINASDIKISWTEAGTVLFNNALGAIKGNGQPTSLVSENNGGTQTITYTNRVNNQFGYPKYSAVVDSSSVNWPIYGNGPVSTYPFPSVYIYGAEANGTIPSVNSDVTDLRAALGDASKLVNTSDLTADHNSEISSVNWQTLPSLDKANAQAPATVRINFPDKSYLDVPVAVNVIKVDQGVDDKTNHDIYRDITRTINVEGESTPVVQHVIYSRAKITDLSKPAGQQVTYTTWASAKNSESQAVTKFSQYEVTKPGYTATATGATIETVDGKQYVPASAPITPDSSNETVNVTYTANEHTLVINYVDGNGTVEGTYNVPGKTDETVNVDVPGHVPTNWKLVPNQQTISSYKFGSDDPRPVDYNVKHGTKNITPTDPSVNPTDPKYKDMFTSVSRDIYQTKPGETRTKIDTQYVDFGRNGVEDLVTGVVTGTGDWKVGKIENNKFVEGGKAEFASASVEQIKGYDSYVDGTKATEVSAAAVTEKDGVPQNGAAVNVTYTANEHTLVINYVDGNGTVEGTYNVPGKTDETVNVDVPGHVPTNWKLVPNQQTISSYKFGSDDPRPVDYNVKHGTKNITPTDPSVNPTDPKYKDMFTSVSRDIYQTKPGETRTKIDTQYVDFGRNGVEDLVTGVVTGTGDWKVGKIENNKFVEGGKAEFASASVEQIKGYDSYVDGTKATEVSAAAVTEKDGVPQNGAAVNVTYTQTLQPTDPTINPNKPGDNSDMFASPTRTINVENPVTGETETTHQTVWFGRTKTVSTDPNVKPTYGKWQLGKVENDKFVADPTGKAEWPEFTAPTFSGYTPSQSTVAKKTVSAETPAETVTITYTNDNNGGGDITGPTEGQVTIIYRDANGNEVGRTTISGTEGSTIDPSSAIKNGVPAGYKIKDGYNAPTSASVSSSITVPVVKTDNGGNTTPSDNNPTDKTPEKDDNSGKKVDHHKAKNNGQNIRTETKHNSGNNQAAGLNSENHSYNSNVHGKRANSNNTAVQAEKNAKTLPQTGEKQDRVSIIGLALASIAGLLGFGVDRKRKHN
ncbi:MAG: Rib/alpha-like domain-containing protein [Lactobacillus crispatus]|uniref:Rib/alpha-like domain-containing protein n=1 Tax=Lactobacillus crispatus TaxID=47770 RepID=UPI00254AFE63|nr:Rib/alpha-like domain-containing protein [Lactobacillus crispatus]MDK7321244.1 Rib/alpha-like domain-containing protein [Lactobacillus crispatus]MDK8273536.1 Rib/alpha-like domain-containing protein [Lactobacillus crispatus]MDK8569691.1 Rib/alpha-like domain-containing protein [Lactobacillus crispatus]